MKEKTLLEIFSLNNFWLLPQTEMSENFTKFLFICQLVVLIQQKQIVHNIALANKRAVEGTRDKSYEIEYININPINPYCKTTYEIVNCKLYKTFAVWRILTLLIDSYFNPIRCTLSNAS